MYKYPFLDIYGSAVFSPIENLITNPRQVEPLNDVFIHVIPYNDYTNIIVGYCNEYVNDWIKEYVNSWEGLDETEFEKQLTRLFVGHIENWGLSPDLLQEIKQENLDKLKKYTVLNANNHSPYQKIDFNLFEYDE